ncbi:MAG TPA: hypothetical protein VIL97_07455 [Thermoanaerobaculia bacterium]
MKRVVRDPLSVVRGIRRWVSSRTTDKRQRTTARVIVAVLVTILVAQAASACPVCFGEDGSKSREGMNNAILVLLAIVGAVQIGFIALFWSFWRRARRGAPSARPS